MGRRAGLDRCSPPGFDPRPVQPVASRYTDYAIPAHYYSENRGNSVPTFRDNLSVPCDQGLRIQEAQKRSVLRFGRLLTHWHTQTSLRRPGSLGY